MALMKLGPEYDFYAFCDQDDIWFSNKLERAITILKAMPSNQPALYCAELKLSKGMEFKNGIISLFSKPPTFANALTQNIGGGNTMVMNKLARNLVVKSAENADIVAHDWWAYIITSAAAATSITTPNHASAIGNMNQTMLVPITDGYQTDQTPSACEGSIQTLGGTECEGTGTEHRSAYGSKPTDTRIVFQGQKRLLSNAYFADEKVRHLPPDITWKFRSLVVSLTQEVVTRSTMKPSHNLFRRD